jgi:hypothetical protein
MVLAVRQDLPGTRLAVLGEVIVRGYWQDGAEE